MVYLDDSNVVDLAEKKEEVESKRMAKACRQLISELEGAKQGFTALGDFEMAKATSSIKNRFLQLLDNNGVTL